MCNGRRYGTYSWDQKSWMEQPSNIVSFLASDVGREWQCGDLAVNVADYTNPENIHNDSLLVPFIQSVRRDAGLVDSVIWLTYGDVVTANGTKMRVFVDTFYRWAQGIDAATIPSLGKIGISFDVEHMDAASTQTALQAAQAMKAQTSFPAGQLLVQHTIEGQINPDGAQNVMLYADSALMMLYRNYIHDPAGLLADDSSIVARMQWFLTQQCKNCLVDSAASAFKAKITVMVEAACQVGEACKKISFCAHDGDGSEGGMLYMDSILAQMQTQIISQGIVTQAQYSRLFNTDAPYTVQNWDSQKCFSPFSASLTYPDCANFHQLAAQCRTE